MKKRSHEDWEKTVGFFQIMFFVMAIFTLAIAVGTSYQLQKEKIKNKACIELLIFESKYLSFLITQNDLNLNKTMEGFLLHEAQEIITNEFRK